jgi:hypothetical protein
MLYIRDNFSASWNQVSEWVRNPNGKSAAIQANRDLRRERLFGYFCSLGHTVIVDFRWEEHECPSGVTKFEMGAWNAFWFVCNPVSAAGAATARKKTIQDMIKVLGH